VLGLLLRRVHLRELLTLLAPHLPESPASSLETELLVRAMKGTRATCLHRALAGYALLRGRGDPVQLVIGVARGGVELVAHAWLERDGAAIGEPEAPRVRYAVAFIHPAEPNPSPTELPMAAIRANPDVLLTELNDGTGVLLHLGTKFYFALNRSGVAAWKLLASGAVDGPEVLARGLAEGFATAPLERVREDVDALLAELRAESLILEERGAP